jgi:pimeloyl-ACP methyl ester carboxylesterase
VTESGRSRSSTDPVEVPGPWHHRHVAANGARFHVAECGPVDGPLVLLLHGFPELWWTWRHLLPPLAEAGFRAVAMDLRGYGGSDKTPRGYDPFTLAGDVSGVVKALGARSAVLVGHGWGGYVAWATAVRHPREVSALCAVSAPHPLAMLHALRPGNRARSGTTAHGRTGALRHVLAMQVPMLPERRLADPSSGYLGDHLRAWSAPGSAFPSEDEVATYQRAISLWPSSHCALEYHRWLFRSRLRADGRAFRASMRSPVEQPVLTIAGDLDPALPLDVVSRSGRHVTGPYAATVLAGVGHFPPEEDPSGFAEVLLPWLADPAARAVTG